MQQIELHCKKCNQRFFDYLVSGDDETIVLQGITLKCIRCKRVLVLKRYTEGIIKMNSANGKFKV